MAVVDDTTIALPQGRWRVDVEHSEVAFAIRHLLVVPVRGRFTEYEGLLAVEPGGAPRASGFVCAASIDTGDAKRDEILCGPDFFDTRHHPRIVLHGGRVEALGRSRSRVVGNLEIRGVRHPVELTARLRETTARRAELMLEGHLSRSAYGIESRQLLDAGISDRVDIALRLTLLRSG